MRWRASLQLFREFCRAEEGAVFPMWVLLLPILIGGIALGTDVGSWYLAKRDLQNATDSAAIAAAYNTSDVVPLQTTMQSTAHSELVRNGYSDSKHVTLTVNYPPLSGTYTGNPRAVEVRTSQPQVRLFSRLALHSDPTVATRAVAFRQSLGSACVLALESLAADALLFQGNTNINLANCIAAANSTNNTAIGITGSATLNAQSIYTAGGYDVGGHGSLTTSAPPVTNASPLADPFANLPIPSYSGCNQNNYSTNTNATLSPGVYCNGMDFGAHAVVTMNPGVYIIDRGTFKVNAGAVLTGTGVTIILTSSTGSGYATVTINGGATVTLTAPTSGTYAGVLFYQDRRAASGSVNTINGNSSTNFTGTLYFPNEELRFSGDTSAGGGVCTKIVARIVTFIGNSNISNNCPASVGSIIVPGTVTLVE